MRPAKRRGRKRVDPNETPDARFSRLARKRLDKALDFMRLLQNLSRRAQYDYTEKQVRWILRSLEEGVDELRQSFERGGPKESYWSDEDDGPSGRDSERFRDNRTARQRYLDRHKEGRRFSQRRLGVGR